MKANYDVEADVLSLTTGIEPATSASLLDDPDIVVDLAEADGHDIVGLAVMWASAYLTLKKGYDLKQIRCSWAQRTPSPTSLRSTETLSGIGRCDEDEPDSFMDPVGVLIRNASKHLAQVNTNYAPKHQEAK